MYLTFYNLNKKPFQISADPLFLWMGEKHKEALAMLKYGVMDNRGFIMLTGDVGTGKTTLINALKNSLGADVVVVNITDPGLKRSDFFKYLASAFGFGTRFTGKGDFLTAFRNFLEQCADDHKQVLLIIDEAQRLKQEMLEEIRHLSNIERQDRKLLNIFFVGQDELNVTLDRHENRALRQRMTLQYHLEPLSEDEISEFIRHRLRIAGTDEKIFSRRAVREIYAFSKGYPRLTNIICDHAMLAGYVAHKKTIDTAEIRECAKDLKLPKMTKKSTPSEARGPKSGPVTVARPPAPFPLLLSGAGIMLLLLLLTGFVYFPIRAGASYSDIIDFWVRPADTPVNSSAGHVDAIETPRMTFKVKQNEPPRAVIQRIRCRQPGRRTAMSVPSPLPAPSSLPVIQETDKRYDLTFGFDSNDLSPEGYERLDKTAAIMKMRPDVNLTIRGYTDSAGSKAYNDMLSKFRADIVKNYLVSKGVAPDTITAVGMGADGPASDRGDADCRRVEVEVIPK